MPWEESFRKNGGCLKNQSPKRPGKLWMKPISIDILRSWSIAIWLWYWCKDVRDGRNLEFCVRVGWKETPLKFGIKPFAMKCHEPMEEEALFASFAGVRNTASHVPIKQHSSIASCLVTWLNHDRTDISGWNVIQWYVNPPGNSSFSWEKCNKLYRPFRHIMIWLDTVEQASWATWDA